MKLDRLFNVLVLGGAALGVAACGSDGDDDKEADEQAESDDADGQQPPADGDDSSDAQETDGEDADADGQQTTDGQDDGDGTTDGTTEDEDDDGVDASTPVVEDAGTTLTCSESPSPGDPCGCPCCWSGGLNTDDSCMSFCAAGNGGKGCCDV